MPAIESYIVDRGLAKEMFRLAVEACPSGMVMTDHDGKMIMVNTELERQFGYARDELIGQPVDMLVPDRMRMRHAHLRDKFSPKPESRRVGAGRDLLGRRKDGSEFPVEVGLNPIDAGGRLLVLGVIFDISERKEVERLKDEFVATVSHELRTPLTSISGSLSLLACQWSDKLPESAMRLVSIAHKNVQRLVRLINDILDIEKIESGRVEFNIVRAGLRQVAEQAIEDNRALAEEFGVDLRLDAGSVEAEVNADPDRLAQVVANLLSNAIKFSSRGGEVLVAVEKPGDFCRISVRDHGSGIPKEFRSRIFSKFAQADGTNSRRKGGTGLGLSIVKQIVERLGGQVGFDDAPGGGTIFHVELPAWDGTACDDIDHDAAASSPRLLLCDHDPAMAQIIRMRLRIAGFAVDFAHTTDAALARAGATRYAAILVHQQFEDGDGIDLIMRLRAQPDHADTPIVVISEDSGHRPADTRSARLDILEWFNRPIDFTRLAEILQSATSPARPARPCVLHIDDDPDICAQVARTLNTMADVVSVDCAEDALRILASRHVDLVVLDIGLGEISGLDLLPDLRDRTGKAIPVIVFSAHADDVPCDGQVRATLRKTGASLRNLTEMVRDRLALLSARAA
jgi:PAS domain S-box-containing protein